MEQLRRRCLGTGLRPLDELGIGDCEREALAFALLAWWHLLRVPGNAPAITGARRPTVLGVRVDPPG
jgi:anhydro-N-acetylmuramic acid kinase